MNDLTWLYDLKKEIPDFLNKMKGVKRSGFFRYSLSGDLFNEDIEWGLGNTVFAAKIYYSLDLVDKIGREKGEMSDFIKKFQVCNGDIYDPLIKRKAFLREKVAAIKNRDFNNFWHRQTIIAETRQSVSALKLLGEKPNTNYLKFPQTKKDIDKYLRNLNWINPWGGGSHFSHLLFFLENSDIEEREELIDFAIDWLNQLQHEIDGAWYSGEATLQHKINGAMKVITGLKAARKVDFKYPDRLIDLCLAAKNDRHACDNFNILYVLYYSNKMTDGSYRLSEIKDFAYDRLGIYKKYYWPKLGGFSFLVGKANNYYYGAIITRGLPEPDIHGTVMYVWGISLAAQLLKINKELGFQEFVT